mmetsp:Transcript_8167/g.20331  ORF Transcript_8167/g.20331 Transcript_8167/m.20331 type:complete len:306 (-) Transcript_8167:297-1214(-)|eukprot:CAMPEP_0118815944 /NCGR_PEP_ID=MMETSP1162-20130426/4472_1 /TAXON_ID=33656 /ORGANISM="Phaeocystis Sp, Strain CCMP2710" /LENGTH=305 /DNA_ID=CAMNT_0006745929 /DNA_START=239 /DNA_END=1156 /DNA_ORIENTATION=+
MAFRFKKEKPTPGFHAIDISNLPDPRAADRARAAEELRAAVRIQAGLRMLSARRTGQVLREAKAQRAAATCLQSFARGATARADVARRQQEARQQEAKQQLAAAIIQEHYRQTHPPSGGAVGRGGEPGSSSSAEGAEPLGDAFVIRNLDTGEAVSLELGAGDASGKDLKLSFGTLQQNPQAWEALKADSKGLLEKLASSTTLSFRSYQLCVWQERYVYASDDALCYQHLSADMQPTGSKKQIPYASIEFVGPFDEQQFVVKCKGRAFTFMCDSVETRTKWIKNISMLAGCSASTEVCHKTTTMGH